MKIFKRYILGAAGLAMVAAGLSLVPSDAEAFKCRPSTIPWDFEPLGVSCSQVCEAELYRSPSGNTVCIVLSPNPRTVPALIPTGAIEEAAPWLPVRPAIVGPGATAVNAKLTDTALLVALVASAALNLVQLRTNARLRTAEASMAGVRMPSLSVEDDNGRRIDLALTGDRPTLLYIFSPQCRWCDANRDAIDALARQVRDRYRVIGLSLSDRGLERWLDARPRSFPAYRNPAAADVAAYRLGTTPQTLVIAADGLVEHAWQGAFAGRHRAAIESWFAVRLPAVVAPVR